MPKDMLCIELLFTAGTDTKRIKSHAVYAAEVLTYTRVTTFLEPRWWAVGAAKLSGEDLNYLGVPGLRIAGGQGIAIIAFCQVRRF